MSCLRGQSVAEFERLASLETDDCVIWPYTKSPAGYGRSTAYQIMSGRTWQWLTDEAAS